MSDASLLNIYVLRFSILLRTIFETASVQTLTKKKKDNTGPCTDGGYPQMNLLTDDLQIEGDHVCDLLLVKTWLNMANDMLRFAQTTRSGIRRYGRNHFLLFRITNMLGHTLYGKGAIESCLKISLLLLTQARFFDLSNIFK